MFENSDVQQDNINIIELEAKIHVRIVQLQIKTKKNLYVNNNKERCMYFIRDGIE